MILFPALQNFTYTSRIFCSLMNINAYCFMRYISAYVGNTRRDFVRGNFVMLAVSIFLLFLFSPDENIYMLFCPGLAAAFIAEGFFLQLIRQEYYGNGQFIVMNFLLILLIDSFVIQYLFKLSLPLVYVTATIILFFTFFYLEAPAYRRILTAQRETEASRARTEASVRRTRHASKAKSNFLASTSHEIRTPMNAILGMNEMIYTEAKDPETRRASQDIKNAGENLLNIVNNILDISKIEAGKMELYEADYHIWDVLKECEDYITDRLAKKGGVKFLMDIDKSLPEHLRGDAVRLKQILINILDNAAKYTKAGTIALSISGEREAASVVALNFSVRDTGIGIREGELAKIYEPFERANIIETRHIPGAGLGLTLVKGIIKIMHGRLEVQSTCGEGSTFTFRITQHITGDTNIQDYEAMLSSMPEITHTQAISERTSWPEAKILIVDDTPVNLVVAKGMLKSSEARIDTAESGDEALEKIKASHYDIVFLDHMMPGMDGIETLRRARKYTQGTSFIALTANAGGNARTEYISYGFDDYLPKPFKSDAMTKILQEFLN